MAPEIITFLLVSFGVCMILIGLGYFIAGLRGKLICLVHTGGWITVNEKDHSINDRRK